MLRAINGLAGTFVVGSALRLAPLLFVRPGEVRQAEWSQFDPDHREWRYIVSRTILHDCLRFPAEVIEHQLAHQVSDILGTAYNRTKFLDDRIEMMQACAHYLDLLKMGHGMTRKVVGDMKVETIHIAEGIHNHRLLEVFVSGGDLGSGGSDNSGPPLSYLAVAKLLSYFVHAFAVAHYADRLNRKSKAH
ncbi:hypothetical protein LMG24238_06225 [Paraburkholderia sediminicola]|uniref:Uncharacterized protein n=1 Tax=Paraburkholderia sediminicola TaxID=458836 RepID=A0A6J5CIQ7_9BURK|nr:hypothetical protein [Paraburkholderia sediminicola]CAB3736386.1 hypothetical protein LMG24238_06225 [Paraburkholderia sediminicola]